MINEDIIQAFQKAHSTTGIKNCYCCHDYFYYRRHYYFILIIFTSHSSGEVLHVAKLMNAYRTAFTHFSQRQNLFPVHDLLDPSIPFGTYYNNYYTSIIFHSFVN